MNFSNTCFDEKLKTRLENGFSSGRIPHAIIIEGSDEKSRREFASFFAKALLCKGEEKPCMQCSSCKKSESKSHPDYKVYEGKGKTSAVNIGDIRELRNDIYVVPNESDYKIYLVCNAHKMNEYAQNAILKSLEEPPKYVVIMLECEDKSQLLETVRSRATAFRIGEATENDISQKKIDESKELSLKIATAIIEPSEAPLMSELGKLEKDKQLLQLCIAEMTVVVRDAVVYNKTNEEKNIISNDKECVKILAQRLNVSQMFKIIETLNGIEQDLERNANNSLLLSRMCYLLRKNAGR